jgi:thiamine transport system permease protein
VWWNIDRPAALPALATGAAFSFAVSMGEFGATSFLTRRESETLPIAIARLLGRTGDIVQAQAYALSTILLVLTLVALLAVDGLGRPAMVGR